MKRQHEIPAPIDGATDDTRRDAWDDVRIRTLNAHHEPTHAGGRVCVEAVVQLGRLLPADVRVELEPDVRHDHDDAAPIRMGGVRSLRNGVFVFEARITPEQATAGTSLAVQVQPVAPPDDVARIAERPPIRRSFRFDESGVPHHVDRHAAGPHEDPLTGARVPGATIPPAPGSPDGGTG